MQDLSAGLFTEAQRSSEKIDLLSLITSYYKAALIIAFHCTSAGVLTSSLQTLVILQHSSHV